MKRYLPEGRKDIAYQEFGESPPPRLEIGKCEAAIQQCQEAKQSAEKCGTGREVPRGKVRARASQCKGSSESRERDSVSAKRERKQGRKGESKPGRSLEQKEDRRRGQWNLNIWI